MNTFVPALSQRPVLMPGQPTIAGFVFDPQTAQLIWHCIDQEVGRLIAERDGDERLPVTCWDDRDQKIGPGAAETVLGPNLKAMLHEGYTAPGGCASPSP
jgi:hypothetical protein